MLLKLLNTVKFEGSYRAPGTVLEFSEEIASSLLAAKAAEVVLASKAVPAEVASASSVQLVPPKSEPLPTPHPCFPESVGKIQLPVKRQRLMLKKVKK